MNSFIYGSSIKQKEANQFNSIIKSNYRIFEKDNDYKRELNTYNEYQNKNENNFE